MAVHNGACPGACPQRTVQHVRQRRRASWSRSEGGQVLWYLLIRLYPPAARMAVPVFTRREREERLQQCENLGDPLAPYKACHELNAAFESEFLPGRAANNAPKKKDLGKYPIMARPQARAAQLQAFVHFKRVSSFEDLVLSYMEWPGTAYPPVTLAERLRGSVTTLRRRSNLYAVYKEAPHIFAGCTNEPLLLNRFTSVIQLLRHPGACAAIMVDALRRAGGDCNAITADHIEAAECHCERLLSRVLHMVDVDALCSSARGNCTPYPRCCMCACTTAACSCQLLLPRHIQQDGAVD
jgi:hypothetical protein